MQIKKRKKKRRSALFLLLAEESGTDKGRELFVGFRTFEVFSPAVIEFHETGMRLITEDDLCITTGLLPITALFCLARSERVFVVVPFVLEVHLVRTRSYDFSREGVMDVFSASDSNVIYAWFGSFLECSGDATDPVADSNMSHNSKDNN